MKVPGQISERQFEWVRHGYCGATFLRNLYAWLLVGMNGANKNIPHWRDIEAVSRFSIIVSEAFYTPLRFKKAPQTYLAARAYILKRDAPLFREKGRFVLIRGADEFWIFDATPFECPTLVKYLKCLISYFFLAHSQKLSIRANAIAHEIGTKSLARLRQFLLIPRIGSVTAG